MAFAPGQRDFGGFLAAAAADAVLEPPGQFAVEKGAEVAEGDLICVIEAMKMENEIVAHRAGKVEELKIAEGDSVSSGDVLAVIK